MSLACIYGGHECDGCLDCEDRDYGDDRFEVYDRADYEYDRMRDLEYDMYIESLQE